MGQIFEVGILCVFKITMMLSLGSILTFETSAFLDCISFSSVCLINWQQRVQKYVHMSTWRVAREYKEVKTEKYW